MVLTTCYPHHHYTGVFFPGSSYFKLVQMHTPEVMCIPGEQNRFRTPPQCVTAQITPSPVPRLFEIRGGIQIPDLRRWDRTSTAHHLCQNPPHHKVGVSLQSERRKAFLDGGGTFHCECGRTHRRGPLNGKNVYRCLHCGATFSVRSAVALR